MSDPAFVLSLESRLINAWPSFDYQAYDGWLLRLAKVIRNAPIRPRRSRPARLDDGLVDCMVERFIAENVRPTFRLTSLEAPDPTRCSSGAAFRRSSRRGC